MGDQNDILTGTFCSIRERLHRAAMAILHNRMDADDAVQETYVRMSARCAESEAEARGKLFRTMRNTCIDMLRERTRFGNTVVPDGVFEPHFDEQGTLLGLILAKLPPMQRKVFEAIIVEGLDYQEAAAALDMKIDAVRTNMMRAREKVQQLYDKLNR